MIWDVLGLGCATVDNLLYVDAYPPADIKTRILRSDRQCGGLTATALVAAARFGAKCAYGGVLGDNELSTFVLDALAAEGIEHCARVEGASPIHSTIIVDTVNHTRNIFFEIFGPTGANEILPAESVIMSATTSRASTKCFRSSTTSSSAAASPPSSPASKIPPNRSSP